MDFEILDRLSNEETIASAIELERSGAYNASTVAAAGGNAKVLLGYDYRTAQFVEQNFTGTKPLASVDMSTKSNATSTKSRRRKKPTQRRSRSIVLCVSNEGYEVSLEPRKIYEVLPDSEAASHNQLRVIDESGDDYLYPASLFASIALPQSLRRAVLAAG
ncbi:MAG TPA: hypothetical protein VII30_02930 [Gemmatimonadaceae bacterium]